jgi:hypothetical protein
MGIMLMSGRRGGGRGSERIACASQHWWRRDVCEGVAGRRLRGACYQGWKAAMSAMSSFPSASIFAPPAFKTDFPVGENWKAPLIHLFIPFAIFASFSKKVTKIREKNVMAADDADFVPPHKTFAKKLEAIQSRLNAFCSNR